MEENNTCSQPRPAGQLLAFQLQHSQLSCSSYELAAHVAVLKLRGQQPAATTEHQPSEGSGPLRADIVDCRQTDAKALLKNLKG